MKVLLTTLNSQYIHSNLALKYLYTVAFSVCDSIEVKEFTINNSADYIFTEIVSGEYDVVCFSCYIWNIDETVYIAENLKKAAPDVIIVLGGPETSYETADFMREHSHIDYVVTGEGEYTFNCLLQALIAGDAEYDKIKGLAYRNGGEVAVNRAADLLVFETVPFPYRILPCESDKIIYYESSRGCPFDCSYCMSSLDKKMRALPLDRVFKDIEYFLANDVKQVKFIDRTFNWNAQRCKEIIRYLINRDNGVTNFHFEICGELMEDDFIDLLGIAREGLFQFEVGVQSVSRKTLAAVKRSTAVEKTLHYTKKLASLPGVNVHVDLIAGLPFEDYAAFKKSFNAVYGLCADTFQLGFLKLLKGTEMREKADDYRYVYRRKAPYEIISNMFLSAKDVCRLKQIAEILDLYYNRGGFERALGYATATIAPSPFDFYEEFSIYYNLKGYQRKPHKKEDLYRILFEYAVWKSRKLNISTEGFLDLLNSDLNECLNSDAVKKFERKGWGIL